MVTSSRASVTTVPGPKETFDFYVFILFSVAGSNFWAAEPCQSASLLLWVTYCVQSTLEP